MSFGPNSIEKFLKSNSLRISSLKLSPININKYNTDLFSISNFQNSLTPHNNPPPLYEKKTIELPFFSLSPIHIKPTRSSIFSSERLSEDPPRLSPTPGETINVNQLVIFNTKLLYFPILHGLTEKDISISLIKEMKENENVKIIPKDKCTYSFYIRESMLYTFSKEDLEVVRRRIEIDEDIPLMSLRDLIMYLIDKLKYTIHSVQLNYMLQKKKVINVNLLHTCKKIIEKINTVVEFVMTMHSGNWHPKEIEEIKQNINKQKVTLHKRPRDENNTTPLKLPPKIKKENSSDKCPRTETINSSFKCPFCDKIFENGCALGGHMSRKHPHKSENYKKKQKIREQRNDYREAIQEAKEKLMKRYDQSYFVARLYTDKERREKMREMLKIHKKEYQEILHKEKKSRKLIH